MDSNTPPPLRPYVSAKRGKLITVQINGKNVKAVLTKLTKDEVPDYAVCTLCDVLDIDEDLCGKIVARIIPDGYEAKYFCKAHI